jgi:hypothetical protein
LGVIATFGLAVVWLSMPETRPTDGGPAELAVDATEP